MTHLRIGVVGARRARQGTGPFLARELARAGARLAAFTATSPASVEQAACELRAATGQEPVGHLALEDMLTAGGLDALVVASPSEHHREALEAALAGGLHVLCEKPLLWPLDPDAPAAARRLVRDCAARGLVLHENTQWQETLGAFDELVPGRSGPPSRFAMGLEPASRGARALIDALPHPLSLLQAVAPAAAPRVEDVRYASHDPEAARNEVRFRYVTDEHAVDVAVELAQGSSWPRRAWYALDDARVERRVRPSDYAQSLVSGEREVALADPLGIRAARFADEAARATLARGEPLPGDPEPAQRAELLDALLRAFLRR